MVVVVVVVIVVIANNNNNHHHHHRHHHDEDRSNLAVGSIDANWGFCPKSPLPVGDRVPVYNTVLLRTT